MAYDLCLVPTFPASWYFTPNPVYGSNWHLPVCCSCYEQETPGFTLRSYHFCGNLCFCLKVSTLGFPLTFDLHCICWSFLNVFFQQVPLIFVWSSLHLSTPPQGLFWGHRFLQVSNRIYVFIHLFIYSSISGHLGCSQLWAIMNYAAVTLLYKHLFEYLLWLLLGVYTQKWNHWVIQ